MKFAKFSSLKKTCGAPQTGSRFALGSLAILTFSALAGAASVSHARLETVRISSQDVVQTGRWVFDPDGSPQGRAAARALATMKRSRLERDFVACSAAAAKARKAAPDVKTWVSLQELECATADLVSRSAQKGKAAGRSTASAVQAKGKNAEKRAVQSTTQSTTPNADATAEKRATQDVNKSASALVNAITAAEAIRDGFLLGPAASSLRRAWVEARLALIEFDVRANRVRAQQGIERLEGVQSWLDDRQKAQLWRAAGEISFGQQRLEEAREYIQRSLALADSSELRGKLASIEMSLAGRSRFAESLVKPAPPATVASDIEASPEENEIVARMTAALKTGDLVPAIEDGIKLIRAFPGGTRAKWATDRIQETYLSVGEKTEERFTLLRERMLKQMEKADADRLAEWARVGYNRGLYGDALRLASRALEEMSNSARSTKTYSLAAEAALHVDKFDLSRELYEILVKKHAGTPASREALLRIGLIEYRMKNYPAAMASFERLLALPQIENHELTARHWLWRSLQKIKDDKRAKEQAEIIMSKFPFSYYGLRARAELLGREGRLEWPKESSPKLEGHIWLTSSERQAFDRARILIEAGWFDEAQAEMSVLPTPTKPEEKALRARLWAAAFHYPLAVKLVNEAWDANSDLRKTPFIEVAFPREFTNVIEAQASTRKLEPALVMSLIKQESAYHIRAVSVSNALGLMQIIPPTAREIAQDLKMGELALPDDMFVPARNIRMGSYYLAKVLKKVNGHVPLGLASYNAGPHKVERWLKSRPSLSGLVTSRTSNPDDELWFDEIPWDETSFYVKAILRNLLLYRVLDKGAIEIKSPLWVESGETQPAAGESR